jgi:hypothetical protein
MDWGINGGPKKKNFSGKIFFLSTFLALSQQIIVDTWGLRRALEHGDRISYRFPSYGGPKIFAKKILTPVSENLVDRFR